MTERYMQICLFYGMFPGFFSENAATNCYFANPAWYNRDRQLFSRYMPIIRRSPRPAGSRSRMRPLRLRVSGWSGGGAIRRRGSTSR